MLYRSFLSIALMVAAFTAFPDKKIVVALAVLVFVQGINAVAVQQYLISATQNHLSDLAERKTRHAILLASEKWSGPSFWGECDSRVAQELEGSLLPRDGGFNAV
jgi:hypothetical protein